MATRKRTPKPTGRPQKREAKAGFAVGTYDQGVIEDNARDRADSPPGSGTRHSSARRRTRAPRTGTPCNTTLRM
jgi:hypothetical protein